MQVKEAVKYLSKMDQEAHIVIAWWEMDGFFDDDYDWFEPRVSKEEWENVAEIGDDIDWSGTHETIRFAIEEAIRDDRKEVEDEGE